MWPQSSVDEVPQAQELADAGDPAYTWQVDPRLSSEEWWAYLRQPGAEIVERFLREELGWDQFLFNPYQGDDGDGAADGVIRGVVYLRCAPGETNPLYPTPPDGHQEAPGAERCAPTIDDCRYETVSLDLSQLDRRGPDGIWVVSRWAHDRAVRADGPPRRRGRGNSSAWRTSSEHASRVRTPRGTSRSAGRLCDAQRGSAPVRHDRRRPLRAIRDRAVSGPQWPYGEMEFKVRLFAEGGETVVEQPISSTRGRLTRALAGVTETTENGQPVAVPYVFFDGEVTVSAARPVEDEPVLRRGPDTGRPMGDRTRRDDGRSATGRDGL